MEYYNDTVTVWHYVTGLDGDEGRYRQAIERLKCKNLDRWQRSGPNGPRWSGYFKKDRKLVPNFKITPELAADPIYQAQTAEFYEFIENPDKSKTDYIKHVMSQLWTRVIDLTFTPWNVELWVESDHLAEGLFCDVHLYDATEDCSYTRCEKNDGFEIREFPDKYETWGLTNEYTAQWQREDEEEEWNYFGKVYSFDGLSADGFSRYLDACQQSDGGGYQPRSDEPSIWPGYHRIVDAGYIDAIKVLLDGYINDLVNRTAEDCGLYCIL